MTIPERQPQRTIPPGSCRIKYSLRKKILVKLAIVALVTLLLLYFIPTYFINEEMIRSENSLIFASISQGMNIIDHETRYLEEIMEDLALSNNTSLFYQSGEASLKDGINKSNLIDDTLNIINLDVLCFLAPDGEVVYYKETEESRLLHNQSSTRFHHLVQTNPRQFVREGTAKTRSGLFDLGDEIIMVATTPVFNESDREPAGYLIGGRFITDSYEEYISSVMEVDLEIIPYLEAKKYIEIGEPLPAPPNLSIIGKIYLDDKTITIYRQLTQISDDNGVILIITALRPNVKGLLVAKDQIVVAIGITFILFIILVLLALNRDFFKRMKQLSHNLAEIQNPEEIDPDTLIIPGKDEISEFSCVLSDLVTRLTTTHQHLLTAKKEAESANRAKSIFLANMSHEIRTPLNAIIGFSALLASMITQPQQKRYVDSITLSSKGLLTLINDILDLSKIDAEKLEISRVPTDISSLADEMQMMFQQQVQLKGLEFIISVPEPIPLLILDESRLRQILINLIGNAIKFTPHGCISLTVTMQDAGDDACHLMIAVRDSGIGIPLPDQERIFQAFEQQDSEVTLQYGGTGLGLAISKKLAERMDGTITVQSEPKKGSVFTVHLYHVRIAGEKQIVSPSPDDDMIINVTFQNATIMIVDDVENNRIVLSDLVQQMGLTPVPASSGEEALELLSTSRPSLILTDYRMPGMSGYQLLREIRKDKGISDIPIIVVTAFSPVWNATDMEEFDGILIKPVIPKKLITTLKSYLPVLEEKDTGTGLTPGTYPVSSRKTSPLSKNVASDAKARFGERIERLSNAFSPQKAMELSNEMKQFAQEHGSPDLEQVATDISEATVSFDMKRIKETARFFSALVSD